MNPNQKDQSQIEISDLINESVANAVERRQSGSDSKEFMTELSDDEAKRTLGGINQLPIKPPIITGLIFREYPLFIEIDTNIR